MQDNEAFFVFHLPASARLAQSAERKALDLVVVGSSPTVGEAAVVSAVAPCFSLFVFFFFVAARSSTWRAFRLLTRTGAPGIAPLVLPPWQLGRMQTDAAAGPMWAAAVSRAFDVELLQH